MVQAANTSLSSSHSPATTNSAESVSSFGLRVLQQIWEEAFAAIDKLGCIFTVWQHI